ncbi:hypothetical protein BKA70DRAFT_1325919 [Coprinopsis sp. MPI-PUGE-AT-0042]|nr:hypothetical protein BKA70DRAFT_1325919 [Coprinopsis sp. MPI-PUGE-AT-0042]
MFVAGFAIWRNKGGGMSKLSRFDKRRDGARAKAVDPHRQYGHTNGDYANVSDNNTHPSHVTATVPPAYEVYHDAPPQQQHQRQQEQQERPMKEPLSPASEAPDDCDAASLLSASSGGSFAWDSVPLLCLQSGTPPPSRALASPAPVLLQEGEQTRINHGEEAMTQAQRGGEAARRLLVQLPHHS